MAEHPHCRFLWASRDEWSLGATDSTRVISIYRPRRAANGVYTWARQRDVGKPACRLSRAQLVALLGRDLPKGGQGRIHPPLVVPWSLFYDGPARRETLRAIRLREKEAESDG